MREKELEREEATATQEESGLYTEIPGAPGTTSSTELQRRGGDLEERILSRLGNLGRDVRDLADQMRQLKSVIGELKGVVNSFQSGALVQLNTLAANQRSLCIMVADTRADTRAILELLSCTSGPAIYVPPGGRRPAALQAPAPQDSKSGPRDGKDTTQDADDLRFAKSEAIRHLQYIDVADPTIPIAGILKAETIRAVGGVLKAAMDIAKGQCSDEPLFDATDYLASLVAEGEDDTIDEPEEDIAEEDGDKGEDEPEGPGEAINSLTMSSISTGSKIFTPTVKIAPNFSTKTTPKTSPPASITSDAASLSDK